MLLFILVFAWWWKKWEIYINSQISNNSNKTDINLNTYLQSLENITGELYYSSPELLDMFSESIKNTNKKLFIQTYEFTEKRLKKLFHEILQKWVAVKIIMENKKYQQYEDTFRNILNEFSGYQNFEIKSDEQMKTNYTHSKINILDDEFWIQTANLTHSSFFNNREHFFRSQNSWVYKSLLKVFEKDRKWEKIILEDIHSNLLVCDINCRVVIEYILNSAEESVEIQTQYISDNTILKILWEKIADWLDTRFIVSDTSSNDKLELLFGSKIVRKLKKPYVHTKIILVDKKYLILGSMNLSSNSLDENREIWIVLIDPKIITNFLTKFNIDRASTLVK